MRLLRTLVAAGLTASLLAIPVVVSAQSEPNPDAFRVPLARQPDGRLPLEGTPWRLVGYRDGERAGVPGPEVASFIEFKSGYFEGSGGCSKVRGQYGVNGAAMRLKLKQLPDRSCSEHLAVVQQAVENGLKKAAAYELLPGVAPSEDELVIYSVTGQETLRYSLDDLAPLDGGEWRLESFTTRGETVAAAAEMPALLSFRPDSEAYYKRRQSGPLSGSSGCNGIVAEFYRHADVLSFSPLELTDAPCTVELAAQEGAVTAVLDATAIRLDLPVDRLILTSVDTEDRLEFVSQSPLEGSTWWLDRTAFGDTGGERYTLRLEDGNATGEGPCGRYGASYVTDGAFITFTDARGARGEDCAELRREQEIISSLRRSVTIERETERLRFRDASGQTSLSLSRPFAP